jgi:hypothetical protein
MSDVLRNHIRIEIAKALANLGTTLHGTVQSYDPAHYSVRVAIQPDGVLTGWIPLKAEAVGNGFGVVYGPNIGDAVELTFQEGSLQAGVCGGRFFNAQNQPPPVPSGEFWIVHKSDSIAKFHNDGSVELTANTNMTLTAGGTLRLTAPTIQLHATTEYRWDVNGHGQAWLGTKIDTYQIGETAGSAHAISPPEIGD